jgi:hypothetical protein
MLEDWRCADEPHGQISRHSQMHVFDLQRCGYAQDHGSSQHLAGGLAIAAPEDDEIILKSADVSPHTGRLIMGASSIPNLKESRAGLASHAAE